MKPVSVKCEAIPEGSRDGLQALAEFRRIWLNALFLDCTPPYVL